MRRLVGWIVGVALSQGLILFLLAWILPGFDISGLAAAALMAVSVTLVVSATWPFIYGISARFHPILFPIVSFALTAVAVLASAEVVNLIVDDESVRFEGFLMPAVVAMGLTFMNTILSALFALEDDSAYRRFVLRPLVDRHRGSRRSDVPGFIFIELDGLAHPILERAVTEGYMPTLERWLKEESHKLTRWEPDLSSQTSASQAGILLGDNSDIPAFRWWDKSSGKLMVSSKMETARELESRLSSGVGLLAVDGGSRFNVFSGDAADCVATFSRIGSGTGGGRTSYFAYFSNPYMLARTLGLFVAEVVRELYQAARQRAKNIEPRVHRGFKYSLVRGGTNVFLQEAGTFMVASDMLRGVSSVYCTFFAYDEVAHHSGIDRSDSFKVLRKLDQVIATLEGIAAEAPRPYHLIVLSDHGQSQGATFRQRYGYTLWELVARHTTDLDVETLDLAEEGYDGLSVAFTEAIQRDTRSARLARRVLQRQIQDGAVVLGPEDRELPEREDEADEAVVLASGNLGLISFADWPHRMTFEELGKEFPLLLNQLRTHPGISFIVMRSEEEGDVALGPEGIHYLDHDYFVGEDPLENFGPNAVRHLKRASGFANAPDILVMSMFDPDTGEVAAFEELVGCHGGLGGPQTQPFVLHPVELAHDDAADPIVGAGHLHQVMKGWIDEVQRTTLTSASD